ncbi:glycosyltransferase family 1 protein, partial [Mesorhizobium sp. M5C.F.Ca.IN.020.14.1.1]
TWPGLSSFFQPGSEIILADTTDDVVAAVCLSDSDVDAIRRRARERVLDEHTSAQRARELDRLLSDALQGLTAGEPLKEAI